MIVFSVLFLLFTLIMPAEGLSAMDLNSRRIADDSYIRASLYESWFNESPYLVLPKAPEILSLRGGDRVQVRIETSAANREEFAIVLAREQNGTFSSWNQGSWSLIRRMDSDPMGSRILYFPRTDFNIYIQFRPFNNERSFMDLVIYDAYFIRSLTLPLSFERLMIMPMEDILSLIGSSFPRHYLDPQIDRYRDTMSFIGSVRSRLPELVYIDDGAINENGDFVYINNLMPQNAAAQRGFMGVNCSGFVKWMVDGILRPITGQRLAIEPLKEFFGERGSSYTEVWENIRDPFFGLDWIRNLASHAGRILRSPSFGTLEEIEVRNIPFSMLNIRRTGVSPGLSYPAFMGEPGFPMEALLPLLYTLAIDEPGRIYLAAVNNEISAPTTAANPRAVPRIRQYYHVAVLIPYFNERGTFQVAVFESAAETSIGTFINRYPGEFVNLVRIPIDGRFDP